MNFSSFARTALLVGALVGVTSATAQAQILSAGGAAAVALKGTKIEVLSLNVAGVLNTNADLATSANLGNLTATLDWSLSPSRSNVFLVGYFSTAYALTDGGGNDVAPTAFWGACTTDEALPGDTCPTTLAGFTGSDAIVAGGGASRTLWSSPSITGALRNQTGVAVGLNFQLDPTVVAALPAGVYQGTLYLRAYAQ